MWNSWIKVLDSTDMNESSVDSYLAVDRKHWEQRLQIDTFASLFARVGPYWAVLGRRGDLYSLFRHFMRWIVVCYNKNKISSSPLFSINIQLHANDNLTKMPRDWIFLKNRVNLLLLLLLLLQNALFMETVDIYRS